MDIMNLSGIWRALADFSFRPANASSFDPSLLFSTIAMASATFIAITFAIFAVFTSIEGKDEIFGRLDVKYTIKYTFVGSALASVLPPLFFLVILFSWPETYNIFVILMSLISIFLMVVSIWRIITQSYYTILQNEPLYKDFNNVSTEGKHGMHHYRSKEYNVDGIKKKLYRKAEEGDSGLDGKLDVFCKTYGNPGFLEFMIYSDVWLNKYYENHKRYKRRLKEFMPEREDRKKFKKFKPRVQAPNQVLMVCLNYLENQKWNERSVYFSLILLHKAVRYSNKQQKEGLWNKMIGRIMYCNPNDSIIYTMYGYLLFHLLTADKDYATVPNEKMEKIRAVFEEANKRDVNNMLARNNIAAIENLF